MNSVTIEHRMKRITYNKRIQSRNGYEFGLRESMKKLLTFLAVFSVLNLAFIPLMALYGLSVCPVLKTPGFFFGCAYAGTYVATVLISNLTIIYFGPISRRNRLPAYFHDRIYLTYILAYVFSSAVGLLVLEWLFTLNHLTGGSRAPEILALTSLLLGITQAYGLDWAMEDRSSERRQKTDFNKSWRRHTLRTMAPIACLVLVLAHFLVVQIFLLKRADIGVVSAEAILDQVNTIISFLVVWLTITYFFHFLSERDAALVVNVHLKKLEDGEYDHRSSEARPWGLWLALVQSLNDFSKAFGERTKLLNSFSRFVTGEVAQHALKEEITTVSGKQEELTVIMSDIRDFTKLSSEFPADEVVNLLNDYFTAMLDEMVKHSIAIDKFIGDGILAYVDDAKLSPKESNEKAVIAAIEMLKRVKSFNETSNRPELRIGIGISRGPLIKGYIGSREKLQHTIIGDTVNKVARLEALCKDCNVPLVVSDHVWSDLDEKLKSSFTIFRGVRVKGITDAFDVFGLSLEALNSLTESQSNESLKAR